MHATRARTMTMTGMQPLMTEMLRRVLGKPSPAAAQTAHVVRPPGHSTALEGPLP